MSDLSRIARELAQRIELDRLFGWDVPLRPSPKASEPAGAARSIAGRPAVPRSPAPPVETALASRSAPAISSAPGSPPPPPPSPELPSTAAASDPAERTRREALLDPIRAEVESCTRCALCHSRTRTVFGVGDPTTRLLFVGEAPGFDEDRQGEPFVGKAGRLLNDIIKAMGLRREQVYIANVVKCRPPSNRVPHPAEAGSCFGYLERQIEIVAPEVIVALGGVAAKALLGTDLPMGRLRNRFHEYRGIPLMPTYHPAYLLRNPSEKRKVWDDIQLVMARLGLKRP